MGTRERRTDVGAARARELTSTLLRDLRFERPAPGVLQIVLDGPGLNAVSADMHRELADVWLTVDRDPEVRVAMISAVRSEAPAVDAA